ncbi:MAG: glycoside hydrolase family 2 TIM barrel-domain containing protein [Verrucomicrobiia bacterium]
MGKSTFAVLLICAGSAVFLVPQFVQAAGPAADLRQTLNFNRDWKFLLGDHPGAQAVSYDDAGWEDIGLPHSFSLPYFASPEFYVGYGWYRKHFVVPPQWSGKRLFLEFDGAFQDAEIFVNGQGIGEHKGGYTGFSCDITRAVQPGNNVVAVRLNNQWDPQLAPRAGEHVFSGGIYRDVRLVVTDPLHVTWYGTFVTTPEVSKASGTVNVKTEVRNDGAAVKNCVLKTDILAPDGQTVASMTSTQSIPAGTTFTFNQTSRPVPRPRLWHPDHPFLYTAVNRVFDGSQFADHYTTTFGFRWFKWTADRGFFLNGEHYYFKGANAHQDHAGWGDAVADSGFDRDVKLVKDAGFDFIRGSHYPHAPAFADACDRLGVLFWSENCFWGTAGFKNPWGSSAYPPEAKNQPGFEQSVRNSLRDMIRINRNHPSIIVWSMDNEVFFTDPSTLPKVRTFLRGLVAYSHELDPTRPAAIGGCQRGDIDKLGDIAGYNGDGARLFINPGIRSVVTEYGSTMADRPGPYEPGWGDLVTGPGDKSKPFFWRYPWRSGEALWCAFDHGSIAGRRFGAMGMVDYFRLPKRMWYWYRNEYRHIPPPAWPVGGAPAGLRLTADTTTLKSVDGTQDAQLIVRVVDAHGTALSNSPPVTLAVVSGPGQFPTGPSISFAPDSDIAIRAGAAAMEFRSYYGGQTVIRATSPGLKDATITLTSLGEPKYIPGVTPPVPARPYVRFEGQAASGGTAPPNSIFGLENPTRASSEAPGHKASLGNDGNPATFWQADDNDTNAWWQVDLERIVTANETTLVFPTEGNWRYRVEISDDGSSDWKLVADQTRTASTEKVRIDNAPHGSRGRFLRVTFTGLPAGQPAALAEADALGTLK